jgi:hypothetical protein
MPPVPFAEYMTPVTRQRARSENVAYLNCTPIDYPLAAAKAFSTLSDSFNFVYISGSGASMYPINGSVEASTIPLRC